MAGSVTQSSIFERGIFSKIVFDWTSDSTGAADLTTTQKFSGEILTIQHIPATGAAAPTTAYDVVLNNDDGVDLMAGTGANITVPGNKTSQNASAGTAFPVVVDSALTLAVTNAGSAKQGRVVLMLKNLVTSG
jgi:hypothetical protein